MKLKAIEEREISKYVDSGKFSEDIRDKTVLITGSKGIVGTGLIKWLLYENQVNGASVHIIASTRNPSDTPSYIEKKDNITFCTFGKENEECKDYKINYIIHAAAPTSNKIFKAQPVESLHVIIDETERMLKLAREKDSVILYLSSEEAYGLPNAEIPIAETYVGAIDSLNIRNCYPLGKKTAELLCRSYFAEYGTKAMILRPTVIQGLLQKYDSVKIESEILRCILEGRNLQLKSDGSTKKSMIYSLDAVSAILTVLLKGQSGEVYNATNPETYRSVRELAEYLFECFNPTLKVKLPEQDTSASEGYLPKRTLLEDISKIQELGWCPLSGLEHIYQVDIERFERR